jgi:hypothetical protein
MEVAGAGSEPVKAGAAGAGGGTRRGRLLGAWARPGPARQWAARRGGGAAAHWRTGAFYNASVSRLATPQDGVNFIPYMKLLEAE